MIDERAFHLNPRAFAGYLLSKGWAFSGSYGRHGSIFSPPSSVGREDRVILPKYREVKDFVTTTSMALEQVADVEQRSIDDLMRDLLDAAYDVLKIRVPQSDASGAIAFTSGLSLFEHSKEIVHSAAHSASSDVQRAYWRGRQTNTAQAYLTEVKLGQTRKGSFIVSALLPWDFVPPEDNDQRAFDPFGRAVTRRLATSLQIMKKVSRIRPNATKLLDYVPEGLNANICEAVGQLSKTVGELEISISWSTLQPEEHDVATQWSETESEFLLTAADTLKAVEPVPNQDVAGVIETIVNQAFGWDGTAILLASINGGLRKVRVHFDESQRGVVFSAGQAKTFVRVTGDLDLRGGRYSLLNPRDLTVLGGDVLEVEAS